MAAKEPTASTPPRVPRSILPSPSPPPGPAALPVQCHRLCTSNVNRPGMLGALTAACATLGFNIMATHCWAATPEVTLTLLDVSTVDNPDTLDRLTALRESVLVIDGFSSVTLGSFSYSIPLAPTFASARLCIVNKNVPGVLARISTVIGDMKLNICSLRNRSHNDSTASTIIDLDCDPILLNSLSDHVADLDGVISSDVRQFKAESLSRLQAFSGSPKQSYYKKGGGGGVAIERTKVLEVMSDRLSRTMDATRQVIVMVGLPARGKSFISRKLAAFLSWGTHIRSRVFNAGRYRRKVQEDLSRPGEVGGSKIDPINAKVEANSNKALASSDPSPEVAEKLDSKSLGHNRSREANSSFGASGGGAASFFDATNSNALQQREAAADACMHDILSFLFEDSSSSSCAIFDATNSTRQRRRKIVDRFAPHGVRVIFVEILCTDERVLEENILNKVRGSIDYLGMPLESALFDFRNRIANYAAVYEPIDGVLDADLSFITLANMANRCVLNKVFGTITTVVVPFLIALHVALRPIWFFIVDDKTAESKNFAVPVTSWIRTAIWMRSHERLGIQRSETLSLSESRNETGDLNDGHGNRIEKVPIFTPGSKGVRDIGVAVSKIVGESHEEMFHVVHKIRTALDTRVDWGGVDSVDLSARLVPLVIELEQQTGPALVIAGPLCTRALLAYFLQSKSLLNRDLPAAGSTIIELIPEQGGNWKELQHDLE